MNIKKTIENIGRRVIGKGPEVNFTNSVEKYALENGISQEEAKKVLLFENFDSLSDEFHLTGSMEFDSEEYQNFLAGIRETFSEAELETFKANALLPTFNSIPVTISPREFAQVKKKFQDHFEGNNPNKTILRETAENIKEMRQLLNRVSICPDIGTCQTMSELIILHPDIAGDFGRIMYLKEQIDSAKERFGDSILFEKDLEDLKTQTREIFSKSTLKEVGTFFKSIWKSTGAVSKGDFLGAMTHATTAFARISGKAAWGAAKFGFKGLKTAASYTKVKTN